MNPNHDENGRFASGPGGGGVLKMSRRASDFETHAKNLGQKVTHDGSNQLSIHHSGGVTSVHHDGNRVKAMRTGDHRVANPVVAKLHEHIADHPSYGIKSPKQSAPPPAKRGSADAHMRVAGGSKESPRPSVAHGASDNPQLRAATPKLPPKLVEAKQRIFDKPTNPAVNMARDSTEHSRMTSIHNASMNAREDAIAARNGFKRKASGYGFEIDHSSPVHQSSTYANGRPGDRKARKARGGK